MNTKSQRKRPIGLTLATAAALVSLVAAGNGVVGGVPNANAADETDLASLVNPFVGTASEGNAYPGSIVPFGMVQLSPDNANSYGNTSYNPNSNWVWGFSHRHINSAGCPAAGEILVTPSVTASPTTNRVSNAKKTGGTEEAHAGYYSVELNNDVKAELTTSTRVGFHRYTFPKTETANISFNVGQTLRDVGASEVSWVDNQTLEGWVSNGGFCGSTPQKQKVFFSAKFSRPAETIGTWAGNSGNRPGVETSSVDRGQNGAVATFDTTEEQEVQIAVGISFVGVDGARGNREAETESGAIGFDPAKEAAESAWNDQLAKISVTASDDARRIFYTQLYKALLSPTIGSDVDGRYFGMDHQVHKADGWTYYQTFSLWDTYRTQATLHGLIEKERATDIVRSMYQHRVEGGWFPRWSLGAIETNIMAGDPVSAWVAENFTMGTVPEDIADEMWAYLVENATTKPPAGVMSVGRQSAEFYIANKHIPFYPENEGGLGSQFEEYRHGGSSTMEFSISDAAIGAAAQRMGKADDAAVFLERGQNWRRLWNPAVELSGGFKGIVNGVRPNGQFQPVSEYTDVTRSGFHEATQWQYQWMANQDFVGLQSVMGGHDSLMERLNYYFDMNTLLQNPGRSPGRWAAGGSTYYTSIGYNPGNEPTIMNPWLYSAFGEPAGTSDVLAANLNRFPNTPGGGVGNDDLGTLGAWYVMAALGFQPVVPGSGMFAINAPRVEAATIRMDNGKTVEITADGSDESMPRYIQSLSLNGKEHGKTWFDIEDISEGGVLDFSLSTNRESKWGTEKSAWLPSASVPLVINPSAEVVSQAEFTAGEASTVALGTVSLPDGEDASEVGIAAKLVVGETEYPVEVTETDNGYSLELTATFADAGNLEGVLTLFPRNEAPRFAPEYFSAITKEIEIVVAEGELQVKATADTRCVAKKVTLAVTVANEDEAAVNVLLTSPYGEKSLSNVLPGKKASQAFSSRLGSIPAGEVIVKAESDGRVVELSVPFAEVSCQ